MSSSSSLITHRPTDSNIMSLFTSKPRISTTGLNIPFRQELKGIVISSPVITTATTLHSNEFSVTRRTADPVKPSWFCASHHGGGIPRRKPVEVKQPKPIHLGHGPPSSGFLHECCHIPQPILDLFVYLARQGVHSSDLFRRPGNINQMKQILHRFGTGDTVDWDEYNVYTVANVAKKLLLSIPGGLFGPDGEAELLATADSSCSSELEQITERLLRTDRRKQKNGTDGGDNEPDVVGDPKRTYPCNAQLEQPNLHPLLPSPLCETAAKTVTFVDNRTACGPQQPSRPSCWPRGSIQQLHQLSEVAGQRISVFLRVLDSLPSSHQQLSVLMIGILHHLVFHSASNSAKSMFASMIHLGRLSALTTSWKSPVPSGVQDADVEDQSAPEIPLLTLAEGVVKSVAGALFHTCPSSVSMVEQTAQVLRSLVLYFPAMGEPVVRFYLDAVNDRIPLASTSNRPASSLNTSDQLVCVLCPESERTALLDQCSLNGSYARPCPVNLLQAASRLFCLGNSGTDSHPKGGGAMFLITHTTTTTTSTATTTTTTLTTATCKPSGFRSRFGCPLFMSKLHPSPVPQTLHITTNPVTLPFLNSTNQYPENTIASSVSYQSRSTSEHATDTLVSKPSHFSMQTAMIQPILDPKVDTNKSNYSDECTSDRYVPSLRRNQSRYKSLRRRQMENLSRRAEWFLGPTILPVVTLTPVATTPGVSQRHHPHIAGQHCVNNMELVVTSTVSLLELDGSLSRGVRETSKLGASHLLAVPAPRLLFTASTGELEHQGYEDSLGQDGTSIIHRRDSGRQRLLSVGSYLDATPTESFVSIHSAPSAGLHRFDAKSVIDIDYPADLYPCGLPPIVSPTQLPISVSSLSGDVHEVTIPLYPRPKPPAIFAAFSGSDLAHSLGPKTISS
ncbi:hypothetical protein EG68_02379 [Paragonimus skrjabini miyazakii]|uniref:Rho-GAP domain-containing protein n=1 Tax=Paragonimus skrjabini miyazakii TaxID=59628 RepID=A0A8S9Z9B4_9TREM|nr:hypothetical protein EG68_02379 [Paragonimus skrjabini miyazakii]